MPLEECYPNFLAMPDTLPALQVIVVEDDDDLREEIGLGLNALGIRADGVPDAASLYRAMAGKRYDIAVLDIGLPGEDGLSIAARLRAAGKIGIVMVTARGKLDDRLYALDRGADAYMVKPVELRELASVLRSVARRLLGAPAGMQAAGGMDSASWSVESGGWVLRSPNGAAVVLSASERVVIERLLQARGEVVPREDLIAALTGEPQEYDPHRLDVLISRLRRKLSAGIDESPVHVVRGVGYLFEGSAGGERKV